MSSSPASSSSPAPPTPVPSPPPQQKQDSPHRAKCYLIICNISKKPNVRSLLLLAAAFGCTKVFVAGQKKFDFDPDGVDLPGQLRHHVRSGDMEILKFDKLEECIAHIKSIGTAENDGTCTTEAATIQNTTESQTQPIRIVGVEIDDTAKDLEDEPFEGDTAFMMGNEGQGMNEKQMRVCDGFVRIAQYGGGTASLNVSVAASIVLHRFHHWARGDTQQLGNYCDVATEGDGSVDGGVGVGKTREAANKDNRMHARIL